MEVWTVEEVTQYEGSTLVGIYATEQEAVAEAERLAPSAKYGDQIHVYRWIIGSRECRRVGKWWSEGHKRETPPNA